MTLAVNKTVMTVARIIVVMIRVIIIIDNNDNKNSNNDKFVGNCVNIQ